MVQNPAKPHSFKVMLTLLGLFLRHHRVFICVCGVGEDEETVELNGVVLFLLS